TTANTLQIGIGASTGNVTLNHGTFNLSGAGDPGNGIGSLTVGYNGGTGTLSLANDAILNVANSQRTTVGWGSTGTVNLSGATSQLNTYDTWVGRNGGTGTVNVSGGTLTATTVGGTPGVIALGSGGAGSTGNVM